jgi:hypothetical protein
MGGTVEGEEEERNEREDKGSNDTRRKKFISRE